MAVGAVQAGYSGSVYPAKAKSAQKEMDFFSFAPNAPEAVKEAIRQAAEESGYHPYGKMNHISQITVQQVENQYNGTINPEDVFGGSVASALQAVKTMLYDLEHPLAKTKSTGIAQYRAQEREFYQAVIQKLENSETEEPSETKETMDYRKFLKKTVEELYVKFQNGESEPSYQIGAASFTEREWDKLLEKFDELEDSIRTQMREEHKKRMEEKENSASQQKQTRARETSLLAGNYTMATYPSSKQEEPAHYITCYTEDGIFCRKAGETGEEWSIRFNNKEEYNKVMKFLEEFPADWNMRFASNENFWKDFLDDKIDMEEFGKFLSGTDKGVPNYTITVGDSVYIDREKVFWAKYMNQDIGKFYTAQEMMQMQEDLIAENVTKLHKLTEPYENIYRLTHPEYRGERIFCEYPGGPLYTANEIGRKMYENYLTLKYETIVVQ